MSVGQHKKICSKCGKIIGFNEDCNCQGVKRLVAKKQVRECDKFYTSYKWRKTRRIVLDRDRHTCQRCLHKFGIIETKKLEGHHIKSRVHYPELELDQDNIITVCKRCNLELGTKDRLDFEWQVPSKNIEFNL